MFNTCTVIFVFKICVKIFKLSIFFNFKSDFKTSDNFETQCTKDREPQETILKLYYKNNYILFFKEYILDMCKRYSAKLCTNEIQPHKLTKYIKQKSNYDHL